jgi:hypothetical protein
MRLQVRRPLVTDSRRRVLARLDTCLDLQCTRHCLVVLDWNITRLDVGFDFHTYGSFIENLIEVDCGENHRPLSQVAESRWILLANIFSAHGVPIGAESASLRGVALSQTRSRVRARLFAFGSRPSGFALSRGGLRAFGSVFVGVADSLYGGPFGPFHVGALHYLRKWGTRIKGCSR